MGLGADLFLIFFETLRFVALRLFVVLDDLLEERLGMLIKIIFKVLLIILTSINLYTKLKIMEQFTDSMQIHLIEGSWEDGVSTSSESDEKVDDTPPSSDNSNNKNNDTLDVTKLKSPLQYDVDTILSWKKMVTRLHNMVASESPLTQRLYDSILPKFKQLEAQKVIIACVGHKGQGKSEVVNKLSSSPEWLERYNIPKSKYGTFPLTSGLGANSLTSWKIRMIYDPNGFSYEFKICSSDEFSSRKKRFSLPKHFTYSNKLDSQRHKINDITQLDSLISTFQHKYGIDSSESSCIDELILYGPWSFDKRFQFIDTPGLGHSLLQDHLLRKTLFECNGIITVHSRLMGTSELKDLLDVGACMKIKKDRESINDQFHITAMYIPADNVDPTKDWIQQNRSLSSTIKNCVGNMDISLPDVEYNSNMFNRKMFFTILSSHVMAMPKTHLHQTDLCSCIYSTMFLNTVELLLKDICEEIIGYLSTQSKRISTKINQNVHKLKKKWDQITRSLDYQVMDKNGTISEVIDDQITTLIDALDEHQLKSTSLKSWFNVLFDKLTEIYIDIYVTEYVSDLFQSIGGDNESTFVSMWTPLWNKEYKALHRQCKKVFSEIVQDDILQSIKSYETSIVTRKILDDLIVKSIKPKIVIFETDFRKRLISTRDTILISIRDDNDSLKPLDRSFEDKDLVDHDIHAITQKITQWNNINVKLKKRPSLTLSNDCVIPPIQSILDDIYDSTYYHLSTKPSIHQLQIVTVPHDKTQLFEVIEVTFDKKVKLSNTTNSMLEKYSNMIRTKSPTHLIPYLMVSHTEIEVKRSLNIIIDDVDSFFQLLIVFVDPSQLQMYQDYVYDLKYKSHITVVFVQLPADALDPSVALNIGKGMMELYKFPYYWFVDQAIGRFKEWNRQSITSDFCSMSRVAYSVQQIVYNMEEHSLHKCVNYILSKTRDIIQQNKSQDDFSVLTDIIIKNDILYTYTYNELVHFIDKWIDNPIKLECFKILSLFTRTALVRLISSDFHKSEIFRTFPRHASIIHTYGYGVEDKKNGRKMDGMMLINTRVTRGYCFSHSHANIWDITEKWDSRFVNPFFIYINRNK